MSEIDNTGLIEAYRKQREKFNSLNGKDNLKRLSNEQLVVVMITAGLATIDPPDKRGYLNIYLSARDGNASTIHAKYRLGELMMSSHYRKTLEFYVYYVDPCPYLDKGAFGE